MRGMHTTGGNGSIRFLAIITLLGGLAAALPAAVTASNDRVLLRDATISSIVWLDANENGQLDKLEPGMPDVHVSLLDCAGRFVAATRSDAFGQYSFAVAAGCYRVRFSALQGYRYCPAVDAIGFSRADPATGLTGEIHIARGQTLYHLNAGLMSVDAAQLGDRVWEDLNANGLQDVGEPGLGGVDVNLLDCAGAAVVDERNTPRSARTDASGYFVFEGLTDACYRLQVDAPLTYRFSASGAGVEALDSDVDAKTGITAATTVGKREGRFDVDAGAFRLARIGDWVWFDEDNDGIQDDAEQGVDGIEVLLLTEDGMPTGDVARTNVKGYYEFKHVHPGRYRLQFVVPAPYAIGLENQGIDVQLDSNANSLGTSRVFSVMSGRTKMDVDLALREARAVEITMEKLTNGVDADEPTGPFVAAGGDVLWEYIVTNSGTADLFDITVVDDQGVSVTCPGTFLDTGASFTCTAATNNAQAGQYVNVAEVCGNDRTDDPIEVCTTDTSHYFGSVPGIMIETLTNGDDADLPLGPGIPVGDPVSWEYEVTNTGNVPLTGIFVTDSEGVVVTCPSTTLDPGVTMVCTASGTATAGQYANIGTASGVPPVGVASVEDTDPSHYFGVIGQISLQKLTNGEDADVPPGPSIGVGDAITWQYIVRNEGNVVVGSVTVTDDQGVAVACPPLNVPPGGTLTCTGTGVAIDGPYTNIGTACAQLSDGSDTCASDPSNYTGLGAAIDIETFTQNVDADLPTGPNVIVGLPIAWDYIVTNTGGTTLTDIVVSDDQGVTVTCPATTLAPGASFTCSATGVSAPGQYENVGTVTATGAGQTVTDSDPSHYFGIFFSIDLEKATNGVDADVVPGPAIAVGGPVTWTYVFVNNGNVRLNTISIIDDQGVTIDCPPITFLEPNDTITCTGTGIAQSGQYENTAEVCGFFEEEEVCDSDPSHYFGAGAGLDIEKLTNGEHADTPTGPTITEDDPVNWTYIVTNNGNVTVQNIVVSDDQGVTVTCPTDTLAPAATMTCTASGIATVGQYANIGSATGQGVDDNGNPVGDPVGDTDPSHYIGAPIATASIGDFVWVDTDRDGVQDAGEPGVPGVVVTLWTDTDGDGSPDTILTTTTTDANGMYLFDNLDPRLVYFVQFGAVPGQPFTTPNVGDDAADSDADPATGISGAITLSPGQTDLTVDAGVIALTGGVSIDKFTNGQDADTPTGPTLPVGSTVNWTYEVTNNGELTLDNIVVSDDQGVTVTCPATSLAPGATMTCTGSGTASAGQYVNIGSVTGQPTDNGTPVGDPVGGSDPSHYFGAGAGLDIEKLTNGEHADTPTGPTITEDDPVNWTYIVTNNGNVTVQNIVVSDDQGVTVTCPTDTLAPAATMTCTASGIATVGQYANIGSATGQGVDDNGNPVGDPVGDTDPSHYIGAPIATASIGDFVWVDTDRDGVQDAGEPGVPGVVVTLWTDTDGDGSPDTILTTTTTDANGMYLFDNLDPRLVYFVQFGAVPGQPFTTPNVGDDAADSDADPATGISGAITLSPGQTDLTVDAGVIALTGGVSIDKFTNGQDADTPTGPTLPVGSTVNWTYEVTNNGELTLDNIVVSDDQGVTVTCPATSLAPGATMTCTGSGTASAGQYVNIGSVTGQPTDNGTPVGDPVGGSDPSHYFGAGAGLDIEKLTNGEHADTPTGPTITEDDPVNWTYIVTNNGNVTVQNIVVSDDQGVTVTCPTDTLAPAATMTCTASGIATVGQYANIGSATGQGVDDNGNPVGDPVGDTDPSHYIGAPIATASIGDFVWVDTDRDGVQDAGEPGVPGVVVTLWTDTDGDGSPDTILTTTTTDANGMYLFDNLDPRLVYFVQFGAVPGQPFTTPNVGDDAADSDADPATGISGAITLSPGQTDLTVDAGVIALTGGVSIDKFTNGQDADTPTGPTLPVGSTVNWTYEVTNNGELTLDNIVVSDDQGVTVTCPATSLAPGATMTCTGSGTASAGQYVNIGSVTGQPTDNGTPVGDPVGGSDPSHYFGAGAGLDIEKLTNGEHADTPTGPTVTEGQPIEWTYVVTNNGNVTVQNIVVSDDQGVTVNCPQSALAPGATMTCTGNGIATVGQYANIGSATGQGVDDNGNPVGDPVGDTDPSHYLGTPLAVASLGDFLFIDADRDGIQDPGEPGLAGVIVTLWIDEDGDGLPDTVVASTVTDANGLYLYENLDSRLTYIVQFAPTPGTLFTAMDQGGDDALDSDVSPATGITGPITLLPGQSDLSIDAGVIELRREVDIEKSTNGEDADTPTGPAIMVGDPVVWTYVVTNSGELPLSDIVVTDSEGVAVMCPSTTLPQSASMTCTGNGIAMEGQYSNIGMVSGQPTDGGEPVGAPVSDTDMSHYIGTGAQCIDADIADNFDQVSYSNNDGSMDWYNDWKEFDPQGGGAASGAIRIDDGVLILSDYPNSHQRPSIRRTADLSGEFEAAMLMFDWSTSKEVDKKDEITLKISSDNGVTFSVLDVFRDNDGANSGFASYDITAYMSQRTVIKFVVTNRYGARWDKFMVDNLRILKKCDGGDCVVSSSPGHSIWIPNFNGDGNVDRFDFDPGSTFSQEDDGSARIVGIARNQLDASEAFMVDVNLAGRTTMPPPGSPKNGIGASTADWVYYPLWSGTMTGVEDYDGAQVTLARMGPAFQVGTGANDKPADIDVFGGSGWFNFTRTQQAVACLTTGADCISATGNGDFNIRIDCPPNGQACSANETPYHALYLPNFNSDGVLDRYELEDGSQFVASADGSARLMGVIYKNDEPNYRFEIDVTMSGATTSPPSGSPYNPFGADPGDWSYYPVWTGTLTGQLWNTGASLSIERRGASFQVGTGANAHDGEQNEYGASGWFAWVTSGQPIDCEVYGDCIAPSGDGDINVRLDCPLQ